MDFSKISIRAFKADRDLESCELYASGHRQVLASYGVDEIVAPDNSWFYDPNVYVIVVETFDRKRVLGGAKIQISVPEIDLPCQKALRPLDPDIDKLIAKYRENGTGEFCGLWNSREVAGWGVGSIFLGRAGVAKVGAAITERLNIGSLFVLAASYTLPIAQRVGFVRETTLKNDGCFNYPTEEFKAYLAVLKDPNKLIHALENERLEIMSLRENPIQQKKEKGPKGETEVFYNLDF